jgi:hypothetical protein
MVVFMPRPKPFVTAVVVCLAAMTLAFAAGLMLSRRVIGSSVPSPAAPPAGKKLKWDFSAGRNVSAVGWPLGNSTGPWLIDGPGEVEVVLPDGRKGTFPFAGVEVRQEGGLVRTIGVLAAAEPLDPARQRAGALLDAWGLGGHPSLDAWYEKRRRDGLGDRDTEGPNWADKFDHDQPFPRVGVAVLTTYRSDIPWCVQWNVIFARTASTAPVRTHVTIPPE